MKDEIKKFILDNNLLYPSYNKNISRRFYWDSRNKDWANYLFENYERYNNYCSIRFSNFLRNFIFDEIIPNFFKDVEDYLSNTKILQCNSETKLFKSFFEEGKKFVKFEPKSMTELIYCFRNSLKYRPTCKECDSETDFFSFKMGYRKFCSQQCQINFNNKIKEIGRSNLDIDIIREKIDLIALDHRNLSNEFIASNFLNILDATKEFQNIPVNERLYIFQNELSWNDTICKPCGNKRIFNSQGSGYSSTCGRKICIGVCKGGSNYYNENDLNIRVGKGGSSFESGFLYILESKKINGLKIGITQNPIDRISKLRRFVPDLKIKDCFWLEKELHKTEQMLHKLFSKKQIITEDTFEGYSEFFDLNEEDLKEIRGLVNEIKQ